VHNDANRHLQNYIGRHSQRLSTETICDVGHSTRQEAFPDIQPDTALVFLALQAIGLLVKGTSWKNE
jgi:hypothetical protein